MATEAEIYQFFENYNPSGGWVEEWNGWCQAFVARCTKEFGAWSRDYETARDARAASGWLNPDPTTAPAGAIGYWLWSTEDHVAVSLGNGWWLMGYHGVDNFIGGVARNAGTITFDRFQVVAKLPWLGWSATNGGNVVSVGPEPIPVPAPVDLPVPVEPPVELPPVVIPPVEPPVVVPPVDPAPLPRPDPIPPFTDRQVIGGIVAGIAALVTVVITVIVSFLTSGTVG